MSPDNRENFAMIDEADKISSLIATARKLLEDNKMVDLKALEGRVADLCQRIEAAPTGEVAPIRNTVNTILADLDLLADELAQQNKRVQQIKTAEDLKRAAHAYGNDD